MTKIAPTILGVISIAACALLSATEAKAVPLNPFVETIEQVGPNVVASGSGEFDVTGLTFQLGGGGFFPVPEMRPELALMFLSANPMAPNIPPADLYTGLHGPTNFGPGVVGPFDVPNTATGPLGGMALNGPTQLILPNGYTSGTVLTNQETFDNTTLALLGLTPGTYVWRWGGTFAPGVGGAPNQSFTLIIGATPLPAAFSLFATGLCVIGLLGWLKSRAALWVPGRGTNDRHLTETGTTIQTDFIHQILPPTALILGLVLTIVWISFLAYEVGRLFEATL